MYENNTKTNKCRIILLAVFYKCEIENNESFMFQIPQNVLFDKLKTMETLFWNV